MQSKICIWCIFGCQNND